MIEITQDLLIELFDYRDGELYWKVSRGNGLKIGDLAGNIRKDGYRQIMINGKMYLIHRLIFLYHYGYLPKYLDHIDGNRSNNDILNLRKATNRENCMNREKDKYNNDNPTSSVFKGVCWHKQHEKWMSYITINKKRKHLGLFTIEIDAALAYDRAAIAAFGEFAKLNDIAKDL